MAGLLSALKPGKEQTQRIALVHSRRIFRSAAASRFQGFANCAHDSYDTVSRTAPRRGAVMEFGRRRWDCRD